MHCVDTMQIKIGRITLALVISTKGTLILGTPLPDALSLVAQTNRIYYMHDLTSGYVQQRDIYTGDIPTWSTVLA